ncbi:hypothetical protein Q31b_16650 [Novipirellula aureliae]|uniref:DUF3307 domain-containing protein n=1 Tax=Novipirellula aureliae TaxID=2527966 RepID=A0A5C6EAE4_9BACT|nr:DUF3307 domain-containing protein [Novipirellula aureliae]TWU44129.1 hypothetical protein Q31b_16650 [Novipirellula aureliae]
MEETLLALIAAHFLGDFPFQNKEMVDNKRQWKILLLHVGIITIMSFILLGNFHFFLLLGVFGSHLIFDKLKISLNEDKWLYFVVDQIAHVIALIALSYFCHDVAANGWWPKFFASSYLPWFYATQCLIAGYIVVVPAGGILIGKLTVPIRREIEKESEIVLRKSEKPATDNGSPESDYLTEGLTNGGMYIGWLERFLTMLLILIGHPTGIGFLIAAKSILRFGEIKESRHRKLAEYIIIGTFLSFGWALLMSVATKKSVDHWIPATSQKPEPARVIIEYQPPMTTPAVTQSMSIAPATTALLPTTATTEPATPVKMNQTDTEPQQATPPSANDDTADKDETAKDANEEEADEAANDDDEKNADREDK